MALNGHSFFVKNAAADDEDEVIEVNEKTLALYILPDHSHPVTGAS